MRKRILFCVAIFISLLAVGCGKFGESDLIKDFEKKVKSSKGYYLTGELEITNNEESYKYDVEVSYKADDQFKVAMINQTNNHEQIILKNTEGVYVLTPSLNKSFKFQSEWPYNNSQSYLLQVIVNDINNDGDHTFEETEDGYIITAKANYSNNKDLDKQKIYFDKGKNIVKVEVLDINDVVKIRMVFDSIDMSSTFDDDYFKLENVMKSSNVNESSDTVSSIKDIIFPMYLPEGTHLASQNKVSLDYGERIILSFTGTKPFTLVQETIKESNGIVIPVSGEPLMLSDSIGVVSDNMANWVSNGIEYYLSSNVLNQSEIIEVANSVGVMPVGK